jgi:putative salt-induced outer membrane protein
MKSFNLILIPAIFVAGLAQAQEKPESALWKLSAELGLVSTSGNTETETLNAKASAATDRAEWRHQVDLSILRASDSTSTTAKQFNLAGQSDYKLDNKGYLFVTLAYEDDKFSGYDYRVTESIGYGRRVIDDEGLTLNLEIGPGLRQSKLDNGDSENESMIRGAAKLDWAISKTSHFAEVFTVEAGEDATVTKSVTSLSSQIEGNLSMKLTFTYKNTSDVPVNVDKTDTETSVTLVYSF